MHGNLLSLLLALHLKTAVLPLIQNAEVLWKMGREEGKARQGGNG